MNTRDAILQEVARSGLVETIAHARLGKTYTEDTIRDFCQEVWVQLCEVPDEKWVQLLHDDHVMQYVARIVKNQCKPSGHSEARRQLRIKQRENETELYEETNEG